LNGKDSRFVCLIAQVPREELGMSRYGLLFALAVLVLILAHFTYASNREAVSIPQLPETSIVPSANGNEVFIHIRSQSQQPVADRIRDSLEGEGYAVPQVRLVSSGPSENQVRYFHRDKNQAAEIVNDLSRLRLGRIKMRSIGRYEKTMPPRRYEVWLAPGTR
jgi:hypothetical protein